MTNVLIQGASGGIGLAFVRHALSRAERVFAACRNPEGAGELKAMAEWAGARLTLLKCDLLHEPSIATMAEEVKSAVDRLDLVINASGVLHDADGLGPERRLEHVEVEQLHKVFAINAFGPLLVTKYIHPLLHHNERAVLAHLSARVGSIGDNRLGGWYGYRASKAALNQFVRSMAIELKRKNKQAICVAIHPGTVDTSLTKPFQRSAKILLTPDDAVQRMMNVLDGLTPADSGDFFAYDGARIEW